MKFKLTLLITAIFSQVSLGANQDSKTDRGYTIIPVTPQPIIIPVISLELPTMLNAFDAVRQCAGLAEISYQSATQLSYNRNALKQCPELDRLNRGLSGVERCVAREGALMQGWEKATWREWLVDGTGPYKYVKNRSEVPALLQNSAKLELARTAWCMTNPLKYEPLSPKTGKK